VPTGVNMADSDVRFVVFVLSAKNRYWFYTTRMPSQILKMVPIRLRVGEEWYFFRLAEQVFDVASGRDVYLLHGARLPDGGIVSRLVPELSVILEDQGGPRLADFEADKNWTKVTSPFDQ
jgi:hypothetical protein